MEFEPFNPLSIYGSPKQQETTVFSSEINTQQSLSQLQMEDYKCSEQTSTEVIIFTSSKKSNASEYHNMTKQLVITMKQIMNKYIKDIGSTLNKRRIIKKVWETITKKKHPTKSIFKLVFHPEVNSQILERQQLIDSIEGFNPEEFKLAMEQLKEQLIMRMKESNIRANLIDRDISKKDVLLAYIQHFIQEELKTGEIKARFGPSGSRKIKKFANQTRKDQDFISDCLI